MVAKLVSPKLMAFISLAVIRLSFPCSGLLCGEAPDFKITEAKNLLKKRISSSENLTVFEYPVRDTTSQSYVSKVDGVCSSKLSIVHYSSKITRYKGNGKSSDLSLVLDTIGQSWSCPNNNCVHDYSCTVFNGMKINGKNAGLECKCNGLVSGGGSMEGIGGCEGSMLKLGKSAGGVVFGAIEGFEKNTVSEYCPTNIYHDDWIPIVMDSIEIRYMKNGKVSVIRFATDDILN